MRKGSETGGWCFFKNEIWGSVLLPDIESGVPPGAPATEQERVPPYWVLTVQRVRQSVAHIHSLQLKGAMRAVRWLSVSSGPQRELGDWRDPQDQHCTRLGGQVSPASPLTSEMRLQHTWASLVAQMVKNPPDNADVRDTGLIPGSGRSAGEGNWQLTPGFLPGEFQGQRSLEGYSPPDHKESDTTEQLILSGMYAELATLQPPPPGPTTSQRVTSSGLAGLLAWERGPCSWRASSLRTHDRYSERAVAGNRVPKPSKLPNESFGI